jgi:hypothetical protein
MDGWGSSWVSTAPARDVNLRTWARQTAASGDVVFSCGRLPRRKLGWLLDASATASLR